LFLLWGHSHIFGEGVRGWWNQTKRQFKDWLLGYRRVSAYDLSEGVLRKAGEELLRVRPDYIVGYSEALDRFARVNEDRSDRFRKLALKVAIATAESFPYADSADRIRTVLGAPVTMEYGTAETGPIAYQDDTGDFQVFWRHFKLEGRPTDVLEDSYELFVTTLYPRCFPLIRYRVGDIVADDPGEDDFDQTLSSVVGRSNDYVVLTNERRIHSIVFKHVMEDLKAVRAYQVVQKRSSEISLYFVLDDDHPLGDVKQKIRRRLGELDPELETASIEHVPSLERTPAGKTKRVVRK
jgi:phenylacetate-coenzyme A ligase PaaK-like adenylate-forming protein